ncbi:alanine dehydrogenase [Vagococcus carniphilus]|uniref:Alanine dehydrogenase n=1 Tax=Vagococcus carniphilus TaxID=218144 RepID=A0A430B8I1_9ENTE|nr:alanine dehydrogenase [Vagococcus carniphilus]RSU16646.1 alanine dehydrogenase [Vagococcus carniphilus]
MIIGVPKEIKNNESRIALTPRGVMTLIKNGHQVWIETDAGLGSGFLDEEFTKYGAEIKRTAKEVWEADMVLKVKEPLESEFHYFRPNLILFTFLHLAPNEALTEALIENKVHAIAYESVQTADGKLPLLAPMSQVAGRMSAQVGAYHLQKITNGIGVLLAGVPGVEKAKVTIIGGGVAGVNAAKIAIGLGAEVTILDVNPNRLDELENIFGNSITTLMSNTYNITQSVIQADLVIGAVLLPGHRAPKLVSEEMVKQMKTGSVIVDIAIDQGGIFETTTRTTTLDDPTYVKHGVVHYAVPNIPGSVPRTSTIALENVTLPYSSKLANLGLIEAIKNDPSLLKGIDIYGGVLTNKEIAEDQHRDYTAIAALI